MLGAQVNLEANQVPLIAAQQPMLPPMSAATPRINAATSSVGQKIAPEAKFNPHLKTDPGVKSTTNGQPASASVNVSGNRVPSDERCKDILEMFSKLSSVRR